MTNTLKLKGRIAEKGMTISGLADKIGSTRQSLAAKMNNRRDFTSCEMLKIQKALDIPREDMADFFFCETE